MEEYRSRTGEPVRVASTSGHVIVVGKEFMPIPPALEAEVIAKGCVSRTLYNEMAREIFGQEAVPTAPPTDNPLYEPPVEEPVQEENALPQDHDLDILEALRKVRIMIDAGETHTEKGNKLAFRGKPLKDAVSEIAGFEVTGKDIERVLA